MDALNPTQLASLHRALLALERELCDVREASTEGAAPVDLDEPIGRLSRMDAIQQQHMVQANRAAAQVRLTQVRAALRRLEADEYGACVACGEEIGFGRLEARPEAPLCLACQGARERRG